MLEYITHRGKIMDIITKLQDKNKGLEEQIKQYESFIENARKEWNYNRNQMALAYREFFDKKTNKEFVYYQNILIWKLFWLIYNVYMENFLYMKMVN